MKYHEATARELASVDREETMVIIPLAAVEQHGPHLPTGTDTILCTAVAEAVESKMPDRTLLLPTLWLGASAHHLRLGSTLDASLPNYITTLTDIAGSLIGDGFRRLLFLNGHGGNIDPMRVAVRILQQNHVGTQLIAGNYWSVADANREATLRGDHKFVGHACEFETSLMLHVRPDLVDRSLLSDAGKLIPDTVNGWFVSRDMLQRTSDGFTGRPDLAEEETGRKLFESILAQLVETISRLLNQPLGQCYADFQVPSL